MGPNLSVPPPKKIKSRIRPKSLAPITFASPQHENPRHYNARFGRIDQSRSLQFPSAGATSTKRLPHVGSRPQQGNCRPSRNTKHMAHPRALAYRNIISQSKGPSRLFAIPLAKQAPTCDIQSAHRKPADGRTIDPKRHPLDACLYTRVVVHTSV